jgi:hypothetical protein
VAAATSGGHQPPQQKEQGPPGKKREKPCVSVNLASTFAHFLLRQNLSGKPTADHALLGIVNDFSEYSDQDFMDFST